MHIKSFSLSVILCFVGMTFFVQSLSAQGIIKGTVYDDNSGETLIGAAVVLKGTSIGVTTDIDGNFSLQVNQNPPLTLTVNFLGYVAQEVNINSFSERVKVNLMSDQVMIGEVEVVGKRISEKQQQEPLTSE